MLKTKEPIKVGWLAWLQGAREEAATQLVVFDKAFTQALQTDDTPPLWVQMHYTPPAREGEHGCLRLRRPVLQTDGSYRWQGDDYLVRPSQSNKTLNIQGRRAYVGAKLTAKELADEIKAGRLVDSKTLHNYDFTQLPTTNWTLVGLDDKPVIELDADGHYKFKGKAAPNQADLLGEDGKAKTIIVYDQHDSKKQRPLYLHLRPSADGASVEVALGTLIKQDVTPEHPMMGQEAKQQKDCLQGVRLSFHDQPPKVKYTKIKDSSKYVIEDAAKLQASAKKAQTEAEKDAKKAADGSIEPRATGTPLASFAGEQFKALGWSQPSVPSHGDPTGSLARTWTKTVDKTTLRTNPRGDGIDFFCEGDAISEKAVHEAITLMLKAGASVPLRATGKMKDEIEKHGKTFFDKILKANPDDKEKGKDHALLLELQEKLGDTFKSAEDCFAKQATEYTLRGPNLEHEAPQPNQGHTMGVSRH